MISPEAFDKFLNDIQKQIDERDKINKQKAQDTLKAIADNYRQKLSDRIALEITLMNECKKLGDDAGAKHHEMLAEIYKSIADTQDTK
jgi:hypothetical protein